MDALMNTFHFGDFIDIGKFFHHHRLIIFVSRLSLQARFFLTMIDFLKQFSLFMPQFLFDHLLHSLALQQWRLELLMRSLSVHQFEDHTTL